MSTPNLGITHIAAGQTQKDVTANAAFDALDNASNGKLRVNFPDADVTLSSAQFSSAMVFECVGNNSADRKLIVPNSSRVFVVNNLTTGGHLVVVSAGGSGFTISVASPAPQLVYCDGNNNVYGIGIGSTNPVYTLDYDEVALLADVLEVLPNRGALLPPPPRAVLFPKNDGNFLE